MIILAATGIVLFESWPMPFPRQKLPVIPRFYQEIAHDNQQYGIFDLPVNPTPGTDSYIIKSAMYQIYQMTHHKGIAGGYISRTYKDHPYCFSAQGMDHFVAYTPAESDTGLFGGNSNWRGPVWFPANYLLIESLERYHHFYGDEFTVECPTGSGRRMHLGEVAQELNRRMASLFLPDSQGNRPSHGGEPRYAEDPHWKDLVLFYEYFHGDTGRGAGASHQTGWTALAARCIEDMVRGQVSGGHTTELSTSL